MASSSTEQHSDASKLYGEAVRLVHEGKYDKAKTALVEFRKRHSDRLQMLSRAQVFLKACERLQGNGADKAKKSDIEDLYLAGLIEHNKGNHSRSLEIWDEALKKKGSDGDHVHLAMAASLALQGKAAQALKHLGKAIEMDGSNRIAAASDPDFESLHKNEEFRKLIRRSSRK